jgi:hypothetical protein
MTREITQLGAEASRESDDKTVDPLHGGERCALQSGWIVCVRLHDSSISTILEGSDHTSNKFD